MFPPSAYRTIVPNDHGLPRLIGVDSIYSQVIRHDFEAPGLALIQFSDPSLTSEELRSFMIALKQSLAQRLRSKTGRHLVHLSLARFDQQVTTKFHLDGAPDEALLMLGYEPSQVRSELAIADYTRLARDMGMEPKQFLAEFNPMFRNHEQRLAPYITPLTAFDPKIPQVLLLNNSSSPFREDRSTILGVLHQATIVERREGASRVVNSMMLGIADKNESSIPEAAVAAFVRTQEIAGKLDGN